MGQQTILVCKTREYGSHYKTSQEIFPALFFRVFLALIISGLLSGTYVPKIAIAQQTGTLAVKVNNVDDSSTPVPGTNGVVVLFSSDYQDLDESSTNSNGVAYFYGVPEAHNYIIEYYHEPTSANRPGPYEYEFWGSKSFVEVSAGVINNIQVTRAAPYIERVRIINRDNGQTVTYETVKAGTPLRIDLEVNTNEFDRDLEARALISTTRNAYGFVYDETTYRQNLGKNSRETISFYYTPSEDGSYYLAPSLKVSGIGDHTDAWNWGNEPHFTVEGDPEIIYRLDDDDYGRVRVDNTASGGGRIRNVGGGTLSGSFQIGGADAAHFSIAPSSYQLDAEQDQVFHITYAPTSSSDEHIAELQIHHNADNRENPIRKELTGEAYAEANISINVENVGEGSSDIPGEDGIVVLYSAGKTGYEEEASLNQDGIITFTDVPTADDYIMEVYHNPDTGPFVGLEPGILREEFWGARSGISVSSGTNREDFTRKKPYIKNVFAYDAVTGENITDEIISLGRSVEIEVTVVYPEQGRASQQDITGWMLLDRNQDANDLDFKVIEVSKAVQRGTETTQIFTYTPEHVGTYYSAPAVKIDGIDAHFTDAWDWRDEPLFEVDQDIVSPHPDCEDFEISDGNRTGRQCLDVKGDYKTDDYNLSDLITQDYTVIGLEGSQGEAVYVWNLGYTAEEIAQIDFNVNIGTDRSEGTIDMYFWNYNDNKWFDTPNAGILNHWISQASWWRNDQPAITRDSYYDEWPYSVNNKDFLKEIISEEGFLKVRFVTSDRWWIDYINVEVRESVELPPDEEIIAEYDILGATYRISDIIDGGIAVYHLFDGQKALINDITLADAVLTYHSFIKHFGFPSDVLNKAQIDIDFYGDKVDSRMLERVRVSNAAFDLAEVMFKFKTGTLGPSDISILVDHVVDNYFNEYDDENFNNMMYLFATYKYFGSDDEIDKLVWRHGGTIQQIEKMAEDFNELLKFPEKISDRIDFVDQVLMSDDPLALITGEVTGKGVSLLLDAAVAEVEDYIFGDVGSESLKFAQMDVKHRDAIVELSREVKQMMQAVKEYDKQKYARQLNELLLETIRVESLLRPTLIWEKWRTNQFHYGNIYNNTSFPIRRWYGVTEQGLYNFNSEVETAYGNYEKSLTKRNDAEVKRTQLLAEWYDQMGDNIRYSIANNLSIEWGSSSNIHLGENEKVIAVENTGDDDVESLTIAFENVDGLLINQGDPLVVGDLASGQSIEKTVPVLMDIHVDPSDASNNMGIESGQYHLGISIAYDSKSGEEQMHNFSLPARLIGLNDYIMVETSTDYIIPGENIDIQISEATHEEIRHELVLVNDRVSYTINTEELNENTFRYTVTDSDPSGSYTIRIKYRNEANDFLASVDLEESVVLLPGTNVDLTDLKMDNFLIVSHHYDEDIARKLHDILHGSSLLLGDLDIEEHGQKVMDAKNVLLIGGHVINPFVAELRQQGKISEDLWENPGDANLQLIKDPFDQATIEKAVIVAGYEEQDTHLSGTRLIRDTRLFQELVDEPAATISFVPDKDFDHVLENRTIVFGEHTVGETIYSAFSIRNLGEAELDATLSLQNTTGSAFRLFVEGVQVEDQHNLMLESDEHADLEILFISDDLGSKTANLEIMHNASNMTSPVEIELSGNAIEIEEPHIAVWPGDTNYDGVVSGADLLPIGTYYGEEFSQENNPGTSWEPHERQPWTADGEEPARVFADANGDGVIDARDVLVLGLNYGKTWDSPDSDQVKILASKAAVSVDASASESDAKQDGELIIELLEDAHWEGRMHLAVDGGSPGMYIYGLSLKMHVESDDDMGLTGYELHEEASELGEDLLVFSKQPEETNFVDIALSNTEGDGFNGTGRLLELEVMHEAESGDRVSIHLQDVQAVSADGSSISMQTDSLSYTIGQDMITGMDSEEVPDSYKLSQNYPNPFNPETQISYAVPQSEEVRLDVYDALGRHITTLVNTRQDAGYHTVSFDAGRLSSGMYVYRIVAGEFVKTRAMMLVK